jgi:tetratricopeptide (TPR) repeat protein
MAETRRSDLGENGAGPERDGRIESLLVEGLDRYFANRYEEAVHIWTRVLFLDRSHPRAKAYIDRARTALAERQRRSDELLHASQSLLEQGKTGDARQLLTEAVAATGDDERAAALRMRLDRLDRTRWGTPAEPALPATPAPAGIVVAPAIWWSLIAATSLVTLWLVAQLVFPAWQPIETAAPTATFAAAPIPVLGHADVALVRARTLFQRGRLADALLALDRVGVDDKRRPESDRLRVEIQRLLLAADRPRPAFRDRPAPAPSDREAPASPRRFN